MKSAEHSPTLYYERKNLAYLNLFFMLHMIPERNDHRAIDEQLSTLYSLRGEEQRAPTFLLFLADPPPV